MCGVYGFISDGNRPPNLKRLRRIARATERRGRHAFGFAWIDARGRLRSFKQVGRVSDHLGLLSMLADARMIIGHCRYATRGDRTNNLNSHPFPADGGWIVHNGMVPNYEELVETHDLWPTTGCDSEALGLLVEALDGTLASRCGQAVNLIETNPAVMLGLWKPGRLVIAKRGPRGGGPDRGESSKPLWLGSAQNGVYFASLRDGLPRNARAVADDRVIAYTNRKGIVHAAETQIDDATHEEEADAQPGAGRGQATLWTRGAQRVCAVPRDADAARPFAVQSARAYGF